MLGQAVSRSDAERAPGSKLTVQAALAAYRRQAAATEATVLAMPLDQPCRSEPGANLCCVLPHLVGETARHAGHPRAARLRHWRVTGATVAALRCRAGPATRSSCGARLDQHMKGWARTSVHQFGGSES